MARFSLVAPLLALGVAACGHTGVPITVHNGSADTLYSIVLTGHVFADTVATLPPGTSLTREVNAVGETGLGVSYRSADSTITLAEQGYFEGAGGYEVSVVIDSSHVVNVTTSLSKYP
jgi:hypothetical protein